MVLFFGTSPLTEQSKCPGYFLFYVAGTHFKTFIFIFQAYYFLCYALGSTMTCAEIVEIILCIVKGEELGRDDVHKDHGLISARIKNRVMPTDDKIDVD